MYIIHSYEFNYSQTTQSQNVFRPSDCDSQKFGLVSSKLEKARLYKLATG